MKKILVIFLFSISLTAYPTTYYIDPSGQDVSTNNGSAGAPWKSLAYACTKVRTSGDVIHINPGDYIETIQSTPAAGVSIEGEGTSSNIISNISKLYTFTILLTSSTSAADGKQHICNLRMDGNNLVAYGAIRVAYRKNVEIYNCTFVNFNYTGVSFINGEPPDVYATGNKFHDNIIINCSGYFSGNMGALEIQGQDGMLIYNNNISQDRNDGSNGDLIYGVEGFLKNVKIYNNNFYKVYKPGTTHWDFAIEFWNCLGGVEIYNNIINGSVDLVNCSKVTGTYSVWIHDNIIGQTTLLSGESIRGVLLEANESSIIIERNHIRNVTAGIYIDQFGSGRTVSDIYINANVFENIGVSDSGDDSKGWGVIWTSEDYQNHTVNNINICNNVFIGHTGARSNVWGINLPHIGTAKNITIRNNIIKDFDSAPVYAYTQTGAETIDVLSIENNIFYQNGNSNLPRYSGITPTNNTTRNNLTSNPLFLSSDNFHLQAGSPAIAKGLKINNITLDREGSTYLDPPSIGAFEYFSNASPVYQSSAVSNASPSVIELTYNYSLANILPSVNAFSVTVNSAPRSVSLVAVSGTKVRLTLSTPVVAGDVVLVSYTKPGSNPLQTPSGGEADSFTSKSVTNNVEPVVPVYVSSVIENLTPSLLVMTYSLNLANIIPAASAFTVQVNSVARVVSSVAVSGSKVNLTLAGAVNYGDVVTVSYTKPSASPLQVSTGEQAAAISSKPVTNNLADPGQPNDPPEIVITGESLCYSGFVCELDASGTTDTDNDPLSYEWTVPDGVPVSSTSEPVIRFLAPSVASAETLGFSLKVSDGTANVSKSVSVVTEPYKPWLPRVRISDVKASDFENSCFPQNILDGNMTTFWRITGDNQWMLLKLTEPAKIDHLLLAFSKDQNYSSSFDIYASRDNVIMEPVFIQASSCDFSGDKQVFDFPGGLKNNEYAYLKFIGHGNTQDYINVISELAVFGTAVQSTASLGAFVLYPNPVTDYFYISINEQVVFPNMVRLYDLSGRVLLEQPVESGLVIIKIPAQIRQGIYTVELSSGSMVLYAQNIVVEK